MFKFAITVIAALFLANCAEITNNRPVKDVEIKSRDVEWMKLAPQAPTNPLFVKQDIPYITSEKAGTIIIDTDNHKLYHVQMGGRAIQYTVTVGAESFGWTGVSYVQRKAEWPGWTPPPEMLKRWPHLPRHFAGGPKNPLGARALYLYHDGKDTLYRIHGTNEPELLGTSSSSGCIRMLNMDVIHLFDRVPLGTKVIVK
jgi:lipoprotein-anchoring transpeptidase ErfK/SrfK